MPNVFSYGSNSISQLRARVLNPGLLSAPARLDDWTRVFGSKVEAWGDGAIASLVPHAGMCTYGALVSLSSEELERLDAYEKRYSRLELNVSVNDNRIVKAYTYLSTDCTWVVPPSEQYLTAIHVMLREAHSSDIANVIQVRGLFHDGEESVVKLVKTWEYPGLRNLSIPALAVEVNSRKSVPWVMPLRAQEIERSLASIGIHTAVDLKRTLAIDRGDALNQRLASMAIQRFTSEELELFLSVCSE